MKTDHSKTTKQSLAYRKEKENKMEKQWETNTNNAFERVLTGIAGFDEMLDGGIPKGRGLLITGGTGSGKTVFLNEFIYRGVTKYNHGAVFITFEERPHDIKANVKNFGWDYDKLEKENKIAFVDASPESVLTIEGDNYDWLKALNTRITHAVEKTNAQRVAIDSIGTLFGRYSSFNSESKIRDGIFLLIDSLKKQGLTVLVQGNRI